MFYSKCVNHTSHLENFIILYFTKRCNLVSKQIHLKSNKMKNLKKACYQVTLIIAVIAGTSSCMNSKPEDSKEVAEENNEQKIDNNISEKDAQFLVDAAEMNMEGVSLGQLAQQKGGSSHVKDLGKMMEDQHTISLNELIALAQTKTISLPTSQTEKGKETFKKLSDASAKKFDKMYADLMVNEHKDAIALFEKAAENATESDIKAWAIETLPVLRTHLDQSLICQKQCEKM